MNPSIDNKDIYMICTGIDYDQPIPGSQQGVCSHCFTELILISPTSWDIAKKRKVHFICYPCAQKYAESKNQKIKIHMPLAEQVKEMKELGVDVNEDVMKDVSKKLGGEYGGDVA